jgi:hypothetical protein
MNKQGANGSVVMPVAFRLVLVLSVLSLAVAQGPRMGRDRLPPPIGSTCKCPKPAGKVCSGHGTCDDQVPCQVSCPTDFTGDPAQCRLIQHALCTCEDGWTGRACEIKRAEMVDDDFGDQTNKTQKIADRFRESKTRCKGETPVVCPGAFTDYTTGGPHAAPLRGTIATIDNPISDDKKLIYGPFEAGFSNEMLSKMMGCSDESVAVQGGIDTLTAEGIVQHSCGLSADTKLLDACGGHAVPYHYHERMTCLYDSDPTTGHSTRIGTALDGNGIYGKYVATGQLPTDLDACGGRRGVTPDSGGQEVYYYMVQDKAPFTIGCFGPVESVEQCRSLYATCGDADPITITTAQGNLEYDLDCPCFDAAGSNVGSASTSTAPLAPSLQHMCAATLLDCFKRADGAAGAVGGGREDLARRQQQFEMIERAKCKPGERYCLLNGCVPKHSKILCSPVSGVCGRDKPFRCRDWTCARDKTECAKDHGDGVGSGSGSGSGNTDHIVCPDGSAAASKRECARDMTWDGCSAAEVECPQKAGVCAESIEACAKKTGCALDERACGFLRDAKGKMVMERVPGSRTMRRPKVQCRSECRVHGGGGLSVGAKPVPTTAVFAAKSGGDGQESKRLDVMSEDGK